MKSGLKFTRRVVANIAMTAVIAGLFLFGITGTVVAADANNAPVYKGANSEKVSLMINVYWGTEYIDGMLEVLRDNNV